MGPPNAPTAFRVSTTRQGIMGTKAPAPPVSASADTPPLRLGTAQLFRGMESVEARTAGTMSVRTMSTMTNRLLGRVMKAPPFWWYADLLAARIDRQTLL